MTQPDIREILKPWPEQIPPLPYDEEFFRSRLPSDARTILQIGEQDVGTTEFLVSLTDDAIVFVLGFWNDRTEYDKYLRQHWNLRHRIIPLWNVSLLLGLGLRAAFSPEIVFVEHCDVDPPWLRNLFTKSAFCGIQMSKAIDFMISSCGGVRASHDNSKKGWIIPCRS